MLDPRHERTSLWQKTTMHLGKRAGKRARNTTYLARARAICHAPRQSAAHALDRLQARQGDPRGDLVCGGAHDYITLAMQPKRAHTTPWPQNLLDRCSSRCLSRMAAAGG